MNKEKMKEIIRIELGGACNGATVYIYGSIPSKIQ